MGGSQTGTPTYLSVSPESIHPIAAALDSRGWEYTPGIVGRNVRDRSRSCLLQARETGLVGMQNFVSLTLTTRLEKQWLSKKWEFPPRNPMLGEKKKDGADRNLSPGKRFHSCNSLAEDLTA